MANVNSDVYVLRLKGKLTKVPKSVFKLVNLNKLDLSNNKFVDFPKGLEKLEFLQVLDLERNKKIYLLGKSADTTGLETAYSEGLIRGSSALLEVSNALKSERGRKNCDESPPIQ